MSKKYKTPWDSKVYFDGGSRGNPGVAAGAAVINYQEETYIAEKFLPHATVNEAEYAGCIVGLEKALELGCEYVRVYGDSKLVVEQVTGFWSVKTPHLIPLYEQVILLKRQFKKCHLEWIPREQNQEADYLVNQCLDDNTGITFVREVALELPVCEPIPSLAKEIQEIIYLGDRARFAHFRSLKSGQDKFSRIKLAALREAVTNEVLELVTQSVTEGEEWVARTLRWYLRGLPIDMAIYKTKVDLEISSKVST
ncbi:ribonuclease HI family protein [Nostoc sp. PA-18-2419]|uniref:ribonuclease HI family protein n=1 Tax=Nostoc sp. PA-18-2419 TaxID=2575443 RepID=UPI001108532A|nr:ribonuclease HI family protein [Nostoc sp. PA-18-2419]